MRTLTLICCLFLITEVYSQCNRKENVPDELYRGRYQPVGAWTSFPFTMFNKRKPGWTLNGELEKIRKTILTEKLDLNNLATGYANLYKGIYMSADTFQYGICSHSENCGHAVWVKNNALVHLIGLKYYVSPSTGRDTFIYLQPTDPLRILFGQKAEDGLENVNPNIISCYGFGDCDKIAPKALGLIHYLQAYDILKTTGKIGNDWNGINCTPRNKLREYSRNLYIQSEDIINSFYAWKKNHGIICASALGMAAIVLWDAGTETSINNFLLGWLSGGSVWPRPRYNPNKWMARALGTGGYSIFGGEDGLEDCMFEGDHAWQPVMFQ